MAKKEKNRKGKVTNSPSRIEDEEKRFKTHYLLIEAIRHWEKGKANDTIYLDLAKAFDKCRVA